MREWILEGMNLDSVADIEEYILAFDAFECGKYKVVIAIAKNGDTSFTVDGCCDHFNIASGTGARILLGIMKRWNSLAKVAKSQGVTPFCYPTESDGLVERRIRMFVLAGFSEPDADEKMMFLGT